MMAVIAPAAVLGLYDSVSRIGKPFQGFLMTRAGSVFYSGFEGWTGREAELKTWDQILTINGKALRTMSRRDFDDEIGIAHALSQSVSYSIRRNGKIQTVSVATMDFSARDWFYSIGVLPWVAFIYLLLGFVIFVRRHHVATALPFFIIMYGVGAAVLCLYDLTLGHRFVPLSMIFYCYFPLAVAVGYLHVPYPLAISAKARWRWLGTIAALSTVLLIGLALASMRGGATYRTVSTAANLYALASLGILGVVGMYKWRHPPTSLDRQRAKALNVGGWVSFGPVIIPLAIMTFTDVVIPLGPLFLFLIAYPLAVGYSIIRFDLFTMDRLFTQGLSFTLASVPAILIYGANLVILFWLADKIGFIYALGFAWLIFLLTLILVYPLQRRLSRWLARRMGVDYSYQKAIQDVSSRLTHLLDVTEILRQVLHTLVKYMNLSHGVFLLPTSSGGDFKVVMTEGDAPLQASDVVLMADTELVQLLKTMRRELTTYEILESPRLREFCPMCIPALDAVKATVILPILFQEEMKGLLILGERKDGGHFSDEDMDLLRTIANQTAVSLQNAISYQTIKVLNLNLEEKVQQRTRELEEALKEKEQTQEELVRSQSLAAIGQLVAGVAHEINNPLASAYSLIQSILEDVEEKRAMQGENVEAVKDDLKFILKEQQRARDIIRSLLDLSRQSESYTEMINLNDVVEDALRVLYNKYKRSPVEITKSFGEKLPMIVGNFSQLGQVAINIIQNAIQALPNQGGKIEVGTRLRRDDGRGGSVIFFCKDNGSGIPKDILVDIFKPFYTTKPAGQGTGLGLYICHQIVTKHKGTISVESDPHKGTEFRIDLPAPVS